MCVCVCVLTEDFMDDFYQGLGQGWTNTWELEEKIASRFSGRAMGGEDAAFQCTGFQRDSDASRETHAAPWTSTHSLQWETVCLGKAPPKSPPSMPSI